MGEAIGPNEFKIAGLSVQRSGGGIACFIRHPSEHLPFLQAFFERTRRQYDQFNYLGEWHSHPSFHATPSEVDINTMQAIVIDQESDATFAILLIVRLVHSNAIEMSSVLFQSGQSPSTIKLVLPKVRGFTLLDAFLKRRWRIHRRHKR